MPRPTDTYRMSFTKKEIQQLAELTAGKYELLSIHKKAVIALAKIDVGARVADYTVTGTGASITKQTASEDEETWIAENGTEEQKAAVEAALNHTILTGEAVSWQKFLPVAATGESNVTTD